MGIELIQTIFGMKLRQARQDAGMNLSVFAARCDLSPSYVTEIERGQKHPRRDKIMKMAEVLGKSYDDLVSIRLPDSLADLESILSSSILQKFPFQEFGLASGDLVHLLTREPDKASALLHAILGLGKQYDLREEEFLQAVLRSYQEIHENYFPDLEKKAQQFREEHGKHHSREEDHLMGLEDLRDILIKRYEYKVDDRRLGEDPCLKDCRSVLVAKPRPTLLVNSRLLPLQVKFLLAREIGYCHLGLKERSLTSTPLRIRSFQQILNDFKAAYFGGALLMPRGAVLGQLKQFFAQTRCDLAPLRRMLDLFDVTPEMLLYRFSEVIPQFFGLKLHFLRFLQRGSALRLSKHLNMDQFIMPSGIGLKENLCRRWLPNQLLKEMSEAGAKTSFSSPLLRAQMGEFLGSHDQFFSIGFARPLVLEPDMKSAVCIGFRVERHLHDAIKFLKDPSIPSIVVNETCERCGLEDCQDRAAEPTVLRQQEIRQAKVTRIQQLQEQGVE